MLGLVLVVQGILIVLAIVFAFQLRDLRRKIHHLPAYTTYQMSTTGNATLTGGGETNRPEPSAPLT